MPFYESSLGFPSSYRSSTSALQQASSSLLLALQRQHLLLNGAAGDQLDAVDRSLLPDPVGAVGGLILNRRAPADGWAWLKYDDDGQECEAELATVQLVALIEA